MHAFATIAISTLAVVAVCAAPAPQGSTSTGPAEARTTNFGIVLHAPDPYNGLVLRAEGSDTDANGRYLIFERPSAFTPSPAYLNGTEQQLNTTAGGFAYLNFINDDKDCKEDYGVFLPDAGGSYS